MQGDAAMASLIVASVALLFVYLGAQIRTVTKERGRDWNAGARDEGSETKGVLAGRAARAFRNYLETYPAFGILALLLIVLQRADGIGFAGALIWLVARAIYLPLYLAGVPYLRTLVWLASIAGLLLMAVRAVS